MQINSAQSAHALGRSIISEQFTAADTIRISDAGSSVKTILFCDVKPTITGREVAAGKYRVFGTLDVVVGYLGEHGGVQSEHCEIPFEYSGACEQAGGEILSRLDIVSVETTPIRGRRIDFNANLRLEGFVIGAFTPNDPLELAASAEICTKKTKFTASNITQLYSEQTVSFEYPADQSDYSSVLFAGASVVDMSSNATSAGVMQSGILKISVVYAEESDDAQRLRSITEAEPFTIFTEAPFGFAADSYFAQTEVKSVSAILAENDGESQTILVDIVLCASVLLISEVICESISDIFSPQIRLLPTFSPCEYTHFGEAQKVTLSVSASVPLAASGAFVKVVYESHLLRLTTYNSEHSLTLSGELCAEAVVALSESEVKAVELKAAFETSFEGVCSEDAFCRAELSDIIYSANAASVSMEAKIVCTLLPIATSTGSELTELSSAEYESGEEEYGVISVYFISNDSELFAAAKENRMLPETVRSQNGLKEGEPLGTNSMIIIRNF